MKTLLFTLFVLTIAVQAQNNSTEILSVQCQNNVQTVVGNVVKLVEDFKKGFQVPLFLQDSLNIYYKVQPMAEVCGDDIWKAGVEVAFKSIEQETHGCAQHVTNTTEEAFQLFEILWSYKSEGKQPGNFDIVKRISSLVERIKQTIKTCTDSQKYTGKIESFQNTFNPSCINAILSDAPKIPQLYKEKNVADMITSLGSLVSKCMNHSQEEQQ